MSNVLKTNGNNPTLVPLATYLNSLGTNSNRKTRNFRELNFKNSNNERKRFLMNVLSKVVPNENNRKILQVNNKVILVPFTTLTNEKLKEAQGENSIMHTIRKLMRKAANTEKSSTQIKALIMLKDCLDKYLKDIKNNSSNTNLTTQINLSRQLLEQVKNLLNKYSAGQNSAAAKAAIAAAMSNPKTTPQQEKSIDSASTALKNAEANLVVAAEKAGESVPEAMNGAANNTGVQEAAVKVNEAAQSAVQEAVKPVSQAEVESPAPETAQPKVVNVKLNEENKALIQGMKNNSKPPVLQRSKSLAAGNKRNNPQNNVVRGSAPIVKVNLTAGPNQAITAKVRNSTSKPENAGG